MARSDRRRARDAHRNGRGQHSDRHPYLCRTSACPPARSSSGSPRARAGCCRRPADGLVGEPDEGAGLLSVLAAGFAIAAAYLLTLSLTGLWDQRRQLWASSAGSNRERPESTAGEQARTDHGRGGPGRGILRRGRRRVRAEHPGRPPGSQRRRKGRYDKAERRPEGFRGPGRRGRPRRRPTHHRELGRRSRKQSRRRPTTPSRRPVVRVSGA